MCPTMSPDTETLRFGALALRPDGAGISTYIRELLHALAVEEPPVTMSALVLNDAVDELPGGVEAIGRPVAAGTRRAIQGMWPVGAVDLFHGLDVDLPVGGPRCSVSTIHDLSYFDVPWAYGRYRATGERALMRHAVRTADALIAVSSFTAERLAHWFGREATVIPLAPGAWTRVPTDAECESVRTKYGLPERFLLHVATVEPRKDVALVEAVAKHLDVPLVLAGERTTGTGSGPIGLGFVPRDDLPALYASANVACYSSKYEGFGLPPLEAMACGGVVVASSVGGLPQICGDGAALVTQHTVDAWIAAIRPLLNDEEQRAELRHQASVAVSALSWATVARKTLDVYRSLGVAV